MLYSCKRFFPSLRAFPVASLPVAFFPAFIPLQMCLFHIPHLCNNYNPSWRKIVRLHPFSPASFSRPCQSLLPGRGKVIKSALKHKALFAPIFIDFGKYWPKFPPPSISSLFSFAFLFSFPPFPFPFPLFSLSNMAKSPSFLLLPGGPVPRFTFLFLVIRALALIISGWHKHKKNYSSSRRIIFLP